MLECLAEEIESDHWLQEDKKGRNWKAPDLSYLQGQLWGLQGWPWKLQCPLAADGTTWALQASRFQLFSECPSVMESTSTGKPIIFRHSAPIILGRTWTWAGISCDGNWKPSLVLVLTVKINFVHECSFPTCVPLAVFTKYAHRVSFKSMLHILLKRQAL